MKHKPRLPRKNSGLSGRRSLLHTITTGVASSTDWVRSKYWDVVPYDWRPSQVLYRAKCFFWYKYTTVKCRYLPHTWTDRCQLLPHTMMEILSQFIEKECSPGHVDWEGSGHAVVVNGEAKNVRQEMQDIYDWWHVGRLGYCGAEEVLWKEIEAHPAQREFIPLGKDFQECDKDDAFCYEWAEEFENEENKQINKRCFRALNKLERMHDEKLQEMMIRLVRVSPYMWT